MRIAMIQPSSVINGPGLRCVVYVQGCHHHCEGCHNPGSWDKDGGREMTYSEIIKEGYLYRSFLNGITLSGGEPFDQQEECLGLLDAIPEGLDVCIYTGYTYDEIKDTELAKRADYIVDGPFIEDRRVRNWIGGSANQRMINKKEGIIYEYDGTQTRLC